MYQLSDSYLENKHLLGLEKFWTKSKKISLLKHLTALSTASTGQYAYVMFT